MHSPPSTPARTAAHLHRCSRLRWRAACAAWMRAAAADGARGAASPAGQGRPAEPRMRGVARQQCGECAPPRAPAAARSPTAATPPAHPHHRSPATSTAHLCMQQLLHGGRQQRQASLPGVLTQHSPRLHRHRPTLDRPPAPRGHSAGACPPSCRRQRRLCLLSDRCCGLQEGRRVSGAASSTAGGCGPRPARRALPVGGSACIATGRALLPGLLRARGRCQPRHEGGRERAAAQEVEGRGGLGRGLGADLGARCGLAARCVGGDTLGACSLKV
jgi:hypothetical protein